MSISQQVQNHLTNASSELRSALWHAARNENPQTINQLAELLNAIDKVSTVADIMDHLEDLKFKHKNDGGGLKWSDYETD